MASLRWTFLCLCASLTFAAYVAAYVPVLMHVTERRGVTFSHLLDMATGARAGGCNVHAAFMVGHGDHRILLLPRGVISLHSADEFGERHTVPGDAGTPRL